MRSTRKAAPPTDPKAALAGGVVLPIGEHKGSGLSMFMDIFGGVISGANFGGDVADQYKAFDRPQDVGHFFLAMKPDLFVTETEYRTRIDTLIDRMKSAPLADGFHEILVPGEPEDRHEAARRKRGIPYAVGEAAVLQDEAKRAGIQPLVVSERPIAR
jgi:LDH2 family malate/lactate/ureidoglycolate dehydrogenase